MKTFVLKLSLLTVLFALFAVSTSYAQLRDYTTNYHCARSIVQKTVNVDTDADSLYDTYKIKLCVEEEMRTMPIKKIGDISKWPPDGIPTRIITAEIVNESLAFLETFTTAGGALLGTFQKFAGNDTVYFFDPDGYDPTDYLYDSSSHYLKTIPNPIKESANIRFIVANAGHIKIEFLSYEGDLLETIVDMPSGEGEYNMLFNATQYAEGKYILRYTSGLNVYTISVMKVK